ncbi:MAG: glycosyltransferase family 4 protein [Gallionella sp.]|jgi:glycosyltransferase involved in cell wall biosynthesis
MKDSKDNVEFRCSVLSIELEPTHYKTDLWNVVAASGVAEIFAIYTQAKNWSPDGGHNYLRFPKADYEFSVLTGRGKLDNLRAGLFVMKSIITRKTDAVLVCGYSQIPTICALLVSFIWHRRFLLFVDEFNNDRPPGRFCVLKLIVRETLRKFCFKYATAVLVCGQKGVESAARAGCEAGKIHDFPYVIDVARIQTDAPKDIPEQCLADIGSRIPVIFFSGRMIARKGLSSLLAALATPDVSEEWVLWIEGAGPELDKYIKLAREYGLDVRCRFLGFCQYDLHSWLIRSADIVIVPSLEDNWGIVVDEGLQLGKIVISSDATGSGRDRIVHGTNGYIFPAGNSQALADILVPLLGGILAGDEVGEAARNGPSNIRPADNLSTLLRIIQGS